MKCKNTKGQYESLQVKEKKGDKTGKVTEKE